MKKITQLRISLVLISILVLSSAAVFGEQVRQLSFDLWASRAEVFFFDDSRELYGYAGSIDPSGTFSVDKDIFPDIPEKMFLPWSEARSVSGFTGTSEDLIIGINKGYPLRFDASGYETLRFERPSAEVIDEYLDFSAGRTLGTVFTESGSVYFHFYKDVLFDTGADDAAQGDSSASFLLRYESGRNLSAVDLKFAEVDPDWEPVEFISTAEGSMAAWKYSDEKKTRFRYIKHAEDGTALKEIDEAYFRDGYALIPFSEGSFSLRGFIRAVREGVLPGQLADAGDVFLKLSSTEASAYSENYPAFFFDRADSGSSALKSPVLLPAAGGGNLWYILSDDTIIRCADNVSVCSLPELPPGFRYKELWAGGEYLIVSWEETRFPLIGRSGMITVRLSDILRN
ncbi:MAG: hypothetical protein JEZ04_11095 [Spirochaetales bacterium]|nr:hypothetical protein [Spirochaetales bacterium]